MTLNGWIQIAIYCAIVTALVEPLGRFMARVFNGERTFLSPVLGPVERGLYRIAGVDETREQDWLTYTVAMLLFNAAGFSLSTRSCACRACCRSTRRHVGRAPESELQHGHQLHHQHQLAELWWREHARLSGADARPHHAEFRLGGHRHRARRRADPRLRARLGQDRRQFLGRYHPLHPLHPAADSRSSPHCFSSGRACRRTLGAYVDATTLEGAKQTIAKARRPRRSPSSSSAPMAAAS